MARVLIIGYGNPLRCDDGLAWRVVADLSGALPEDVDISTHHQLTPELAFYASRAETVLFLDAAVDGVPGEIKCQPIKPLAMQAVSSHHLTPEIVLALARDLYGKVPESFLVSLCGECFEHGETLSESVRHSFPAFLKFVLTLAQASSTTKNIRTEKIHA